MVSLIKDIDKATVVGGNAVTYDELKEELDNYRWELDKQRDLQREIDDWRAVAENISPNWSGMPTSSDGEGKMYGFNGMYRWEPCAGPDLSWSRKGSSVRPRYGQCLMPGRYGCAYGISFPAEEGRLSETVCIGMKSLTRIIIRLGNRKRN